MGDDNPVDLAQQIKTGERWLIVIGVLALVINTLIALIYWQQLREMRNAVEVTQKQLEIADRPWIKITSAKPTEDLTFMSDKPNPPIASARLTVVAKNIGHSVALKVFIQGAMTFSEDLGVLQKMQDDVCYSAKRTQPGPQLNLFPDDESGDSLFILGAISVPPRDKTQQGATSAIRVPPDAMENTWIASPKFVGCIVYTIASSGRQHITGFIYGLSQVIRKNDSPFGSIYHPDFFKVGTDISKERLNAEPYALGLTAD